jgi:hypothetical protein
MFSSFFLLPQSLSSSASLQLPLAGFLCLLHRKQLTKLKLKKPLLLLLAGFQPFCSITSSLDSEVGLLFLFCFLVFCFELSSSSLSAAASCFFLFQQTLLWKTVSIALHCQVAAQAFFFSLPPKKNHSFYFGHLLEFLFLGF